MRQSLSCILQGMAFQSLCVMCGTPILSGAMLFTSLLPCLVKLPSEKLHPPWSPLSGFACRLLSTSFFFQHLCNASAAEISLTFLFSAASRLSSYWNMDALVTLAAMDTLAAEVSVLFLISASLLRFGYWKVFGPLFSAAIQFLGCWRVYPLLFSAV